ncbi:hypothetical protein FRACYDRAFT_249639 [Fragilariopsis cylindrus CCMP1102]|uniref:Uncharacterized protein n=1 Tax=Fragilariopsis cylindrus CCMP1102 TaxID=635003 RepID=A0A1E7ESA6_9STRA|nr:hypothetical protein FRACYDRAFT_249639 [Fragilariopsis cylindrus CCMP1102]|eukprot:OEU08736.1 hypothetical protein FRACYDRAFT_249639 [Fragilariopsis cylindrus CCMP1102]
MCTSVPVYQSNVFVVKRKSRNTSTYCSGRNQTNSYSIEEFEEWVARYPRFESSHIRQLSISSSSSISAYCRRTATSTLTSTLALTSTSPSITMDSDSIYKEQVNQIGSSSCRYNCFSMFAFYAIYGMETTWSTIPSFSISFSFYSLVGVMNNFNKSKISWIEKYIHIGVHIYPICSSIYLLTLQAFNNIGLGYCLTGSDPYQCQVPDSTTSCARGPSNTTEYLRMNLFWLIPYLFELFVPTLIMIILYFMVYQKNQQQQQQLLQPQQQQQQQQQQESTATTTRIESPQPEHDDRRSPSPPPSSQQQQQQQQQQQGEEEGEEEGGATRIRRRSRSRKYSFNIFDGTNASGEFAAFIHGGDSDDDNVDNEQTNHWDTIQDHI